MPIAQTRPKPTQAHVIVPITIGQWDCFFETTRFCRDGRSGIVRNPCKVTGLAHASGVGKQTNEGVPEPSTEVKVSWLTRSQLG